MDEPEVPLEPAPDAPKCPPPPLDHLRPATSAPIAKGSGGTDTIDRKHGDPGPRLKPYFLADGESPPQFGPAKTTEESYTPWKEEEDNEIFEDEPMMEAEPTMQPVPKMNSEQKEKEEAFTADEDRTIRDALDELRQIFPHFKEDWLRRCIIKSIIKDKTIWDLDGTANWIFDYENLAPRKDSIAATPLALLDAEDYEAARKMLRMLTHETSEDYMYWATVKLTQKFPQFSTYSLRQVLIDCEYMYPLAVLNIAEGLERYMKKDARTWKDWKRGEIIWLTMPKRADGKWYQYPMDVVKGIKFWCKKKAKFTPFPSTLAQEARLVERVLAKYEERLHQLKSKRVQLEARREQLAAATKAGGAPECPICKEHYLSEEQVTCTEGHEFCVNCLQGAVKESVYGQCQLSPQGELRCIAAACNKGIFPLAMLCHMLPPETMAMFEERLWLDFLAKAEVPNLYRCPNCSYAEEVETPIDVLKLFVCKNPRCGHKSCRQCRNDWNAHAGKPCKEMQVDPEEALRTKFENMMNEVTIRRCIRCKRPQMKTEGCNKLICTCGGKMCYLCRKPIDDYSHFCQHPREPGSKWCDEKCGKCELFLDPEGVDETVRAQLRAQLQEELLELKLNLEKKTIRLQAKTGGTGTEQPARQTAVEPQQRQFAATFG